MKKQIGLLAGFAAAFTMTGCSGGSGGGGSTAELTKSMTIAGTITGATLNQALYGVEGLTVFPAGLSVRCVTLSGPVLSGVGTVSAVNGEFSFAMQTGINAPLGCFLMKGSNIAAIFSFAQAESVSGGSQDVDQTGYAPRTDTTSLNLGTVAVTGTTAAVTPSNIQDNGTATALTFGDLTGKWAISSVYEGTDAATNTTYSHPCINEVDGDLNETDFNKAVAECKKDWADDKLYIHMFDFTKNGTPSVTRKGFSLWQSEAGFTGCGSKEGMTLSGWSSTDPGVAGAFVNPFNSIDLNDSAGILAAAAKAPFKKWVGTHSDGSPGTNCPATWDGSAWHYVNEANCNAANDCADLVYDSGASAAEVDGMRLNCILSSMNSGGSQAFQWGADKCGMRAKVDWSASSGGTPISCTNWPATEANGKYCGMMDFDQGPTERHMLSELFTAGNVGTVTQTEMVGVQSGGASNACPVRRTQSFTITQKSSTLVTVLVESSMMDTSSDGWTNYDGCDNESGWITDELNKTMRFKIELVKAN
ncbi:hypothetical protein [Bdellovibrio sp. HCB288]|uniref:hypothetical protein n=1 Tax=Bdellovibrio sp. HCB288 TaxID=3394355 RepID=UPI0039B3BA6E